MKSLMFVSSRGEIKDISLELADNGQYELNSQKEIYRICANNIDAMYPGLLNRDDLIKAELQRVLGTDFSLRHFLSINEIEAACIVKR